MALILGAHPTLGVVHHVLDVLAEFVLAVLADQAFEATLADIDTCDQRAQIAIVVTRRSNVREEQLPDFLDILAAALDFDRRHANALMEDLRRLAGEGARHHAADLLQVADRHRETHDFVVDEDRLNKGVLGAMQAAAIGIVVADHIAGLERIEWDLFHAASHQQRHAADHRRAEFCLRDHLAVRARQRTGEVERLVEDRRVGRLHQHDAHLAANRGHGGIDDRHGHHVDVGFLAHLRTPRRCGRSGGCRIDRLSGVGPGEAR